MHQAVLDRCFPGVLHHWIAVIGICLVQCLTAHGQEKGEAAGPPTFVSVIAPNRSAAVSADELINSDGKSATLASTPDRRQQVDPERAESAEAEGSNIGSVRLRPRASSATDDVFGSQQAPWYRTGVGALAIVLLLVGLLFFGIRRWFPTNRLGEAGCLRVVARCALSARQNLALIQVGRRLVLVALSPNRVDWLACIEDPQEVAGLCPALEKGGTMESFANLVSRESAQYAGSADLTSGSDKKVLRKRSGATPVAQLLQRLRTLHGTG